MFTTLKLNLDKINAKVTEEKRGCT